MLLGFFFRKDFSFEVDFIPLGISLVFAVLLYFLFQWKKSFLHPHLYFSDIGLIGKDEDLLIWEGLSKRLLLFAWLCFLIALSDPRFFIEKPPEDSLKEPRKTPTEGLGIYLVLDQSGSMAQKISAGGLTKIDLLKNITKKFIAGDSEARLQGRAEDLIGLVAFARGAQVLAPLTLDHAAIIAELSRFAPVGEMNQDGTAIGYAIFKTANMISATKHYAEKLIQKGEPAYTIKNTVILLITDGMQDPNPLDKGKRFRNMDISEAAAYAKEQGIRLYMVNVEPRMAMEEFAPHRHVMQRAAESTGGKFYLASSAASLEEIYREIDALEKSKIPSNLVVDKDQRPDLYQRYPLASYWIGLGLFFLFFSMIYETMLFRRIP